MNDDMIIFFSLFLLFATKNRPHRFELMVRENRLLSTRKQMYLRLQPKKNKGSNLVPSRALFSLFYTFNKKKGPTQI